MASLRERMTTTGGRVQPLPQAKPRITIWVVRFIALVGLGVVIYLFLPLLKDVRAALDLFRTARWEWLGVALAFALLSYASLTWLNVGLLRPFSGGIGFGRLAATLTSMAFIEVAIPSAGVSGVALRARLLGKHGYTVEASTFTVILETVFLGIALGTVAVLGLAHLLRSGSLSTIEAIEFVLAAALLAALAWGLWRLFFDRPRSRRWLQRAVRAWNRLAGRLPTLDADEAQQRLSRFQDGLERTRTEPLWRFILAAYGRVLLDVATLGACFFLFGHPIPIGTLLTGYGTILLINGLVSLPGGLGVPDASVPIVFARLGAPGPAALAAGLTYRLIAFWLMRFIGFISWQVLESAA
jgi:uncharacterized protein (TIRG00374 family)